MKLPISIFWFRRDLRLDDNTGLTHALQENKNVLPVFIFDTNILTLLEDKHDRRVDFIHQALSHLQNQLESYGTSLRVFHKVPLEVFKDLLSEYTVTAVHCNHDYEPYARDRDAEVHHFLESQGVAFKTYKDQCVFEKNEIIKEDGKPYTVFTPYSRKWKSKLTPSDYRLYRTNAHFKNFISIPASGIPNLQSLGFKKTDIVFDPQLTVSTSLLQNYKAQRDFPSIKGTSGLSVYLRFGVISIRLLVGKSLTISETWLNELIWREFYMMILWHFPHAIHSAFKPAYDRIMWRNNEQEFNAWCAGLTGFPIVDAGMRELNTTGFMHNRVRMIVSSFLVKDLLVDWRWGEAYFAKKLNDFDLSANNGGWQWAAGSGCDAAPYFRIFNPIEQQKKFDPDLIYIKKWVPEFGTPAYPPPMLNHKEARVKTLTAYKSALNESKQTLVF